MKKVCVSLTVIILTCFCVVQAQERQLLTAVVPFSFTAENSSLPAGVYSVYLVNPYNIMRIQSADGRHAAIIRAIPGQTIWGARLSELTFQRIDGQYFLADICEQGRNVHREVSLGTRAHELAKNRSVQQVATLVAIPAR